MHNSDCKYLVDLSIVICTESVYNKDTVKGINLTSKTASVRKGIQMEEMQMAELLKEVTEENQTRKILEILNNCKDIEEAKEKIKALLNK